MIKLFFSTFLLASSLFTKAQTNSDDSHEPPVQYEVLINGKVYPFSEGNAQRIPGNMNNPEIRIHTLPYRHFENAILAFDYPIYFNFDFEKEGANYSNWTFNGKEVTVMQFFMKAPVPLEDFVKQMVLKFGESNCTVTYNKELIGNLEVNSADLRVRIVGQPLNIKFLAKSNKSYTYFLAVQDALKDDATPTTEYQKFWDLLKRTLRWKN